MGRLESCIVGAFIAIPIPVCRVALLLRRWTVRVYEMRLMPLIFLYALVSVIACAAGFSAYVALRDPFTGSDIGRMFHLKFTVTRPMIIALVAAGWPALVLCRYRLAMKAAKAAYGGRWHVARTA